MVVCSVAISYNVGCFKELGGECMISVIIIRNTIGFGVSDAITPWVGAQGLRDCFVTVGMVSFACTGSFLLIIYYGKALRQLSKDKYREYVVTSLAGEI